MNLCANAQSAKGKKKRMGNTKLWAFGYPDLARLFGVTPNSVRIMVRRKLFDPTSLESICLFWAARTRREPVQNAVRAIGGLLSEAPRLRGAPQLVMMIDDAGFEGVRSPKDDRNDVVE